VGGGRSNTRFVVLVSEVSRIGRGGRRGLPASRTGGDVGR